jgi:hypothetical protein
MDRVDAQLPHSAKGLSYLLLAIMFIVGVLILVFAYEQHLADAQFISNDELKQNLQQLQSYSAEASYLSQHVHDNSAPSAYVAAYSDSLQEASDSIAQKLEEHPHSDNLEDKVQQTISLAQSLSYNLNQLGTEPTTQLDGSTTMFKNLAQTSQQLGQTL